MSSDARRPEIPADMKAFNDKLIAEFRANHGQLSGRLANSQLLLLTTTGSRSGEQRTTVVGYRTYGHDVAVIASNNGADKAPSWFFNLLKNPIATVEVGPDRFQVRARVAGEGERPQLGAIIDYLERQQALTSREIPVVVLERV